jgi:hypothetical protein
LTSIRLYQAFGSVEDITGADGGFGDDAGGLFKYAYSSVKLEELVGLER